MATDSNKTGEYDAPYHDALREGARRSAARVMPRLIARVAPHSIVDFGCGSGGWLAEAAALGIFDLQGVDGPWVAPETLEIAAERFLAADLGAPLDLGRRFDLALCLEVAEHLPAATARVLVATLTAHAPVVAFSAAIPGQGGEGHVNEAWPSMWRALFAAHDFDCHDVLRGSIWWEADIEPWYRQNLLIFAARDPTLPGAAPGGPDEAPPIDLVHPELFAQRHDWIAELGTQRDRLVARIAELDHERALGEARLAGIERSLSWRVTAPLRRAARLLRGGGAR